MQVIEMTEKERFKMYMKCSKKELVKMLMENQRMNKCLIEKESPTVTIKDLNRTRTGSSEYTDYGTYVVN